MSEYYACKVTGASHLRDQAHCQDAYGAVYLNKANEEATFLAVADGHGSERHDLSEHGSKLAARAALEIMQEFYQKFASMPIELARSFKRDLPRLVVRRWQGYVKEDALSRQLTGIEDLRSLYSRYGTTLIAALCTPQFILFGQIGDGNIVLIDSDGQIDMPFVRASDELIGNATYSLSNGQAHLLWSTAQRSLSKPSLFIMSTDGLANSFDSDQSFQAFSLSLWNTIRENSVGSFKDFFPDMLRDFTSRGSGDDITIALHYSVEPKTTRSPGVKEGDPLVATDRPNSESGDCE
ncbi:PP2C family serine/threonine-protein phosphatase [Cohnella sp. GbtcB17]|uniref:PP2C family serine/threonine-protein phosphatase n=1 Tax=Cohnella sp. GbtcB17 TaxID=2824762 RepID=UPI001C304B55